MIEVINSWIELILSIRGNDSTPKRVIKRLYLYSLRYNRDCLFTVTHESLSLTVSLVLTSQNAKKATSDQLSHLLFDPMNLDSNLTDDFSKAVGLEDNIPFGDELLSTMTEVKRDSLSYVLGKIFDGSPEVNKALSEFVSHLQSHSILSYKPVPSLLEGLTRLVLFSSFDIETKFEMLARVLSSFDITSNPTLSVLKRSSMVFMVWLLLYYGLTPIPIHEAQVVVRKLLGESTPEVISACIYRLDGSSQSHTDLTSLFQHWTTASLRVTGSFNILLGSFGSLDKFKTALDYWEREHMLPKYQLGRMNVLRVTYRRNGILKKSEVFFDSQFRSRLQGKSQEGFTVCSSYVVLEDSEQMVSFPQFVKSMQKIDILESVMQFAEEVSASLWRTFIEFEEKSEVLDRKHVPKVSISFEMDDLQGGSSYLAEAALHRGSFKQPIPLSNAIVDSVMMKRSLLLFNRSNYIKIDRFECIRPFITLQQLVEACIAKIRSEIVSQCVSSKTGYIEFKEECLHLLGIQVGQARILMKAVQPGTSSSDSQTDWIEKPKETNLINALRILEGSGAYQVKIKVLFPKTQTVAVYPTITYDTYAIDCWELAACQKVKAAGRGFDVLFEGTDSRLPMTRPQANRRQRAHRNIDKTQDFTKLIIA